MRGLRPLGCLLSLTLALTACQGRGTPSPETPGANALGPAPVLSEENFADEAHRALVSNERSVEAKLRLAGVVQYQLARAEALWARGHEEAAEIATSGALLLLRQDDAIEAAIQGRDGVLLAAANEAARRGNAGRARALYQLTLLTTKSAATKKSIQAHLTALDEFLDATAGETPLLRTGEDARDRLAAAWVDPSAEAYGKAQSSIVEWMEAALASNVLETGPSSRLERDEALEAYRAMRSGAPALVALGLRQGELMASLRALDEAEMSRALAPQIRLRVEAAGQAGSPEAYLDLFRLFDGARRETDLESSLPPHVAEGASLWATISLYRSSPGKLQHAMPLAMGLFDIGMPEVASTLLAKNLEPSTSPEALGWSLALILRGLVDLGRTDQNEAARQSFLQAEPLLNLAEDPRYAAVRPEPWRVRALLASIEIRTGELDRALPLLEQAASRMPTPDTLVRLASVLQQKGDPEEAARALTAAIQAASRAGDLLTEALAEESLFLIERDRDHRAEANLALGRALERTLTARSMDLSIVPQAAVERLLGRLLEHYGNARAARRAYERALAASRTNPIELELTLTDMARSALTLGDVRLARLATRSAVDLGLAPENSIYIALWQRLTERRSQIPSDGLPSQVIGSATSATGWLATLRQYALGALDTDGLIKNARTVPERTEAAFYAALEEPRPAANRSELERVATSPAIDLVEVKIARDLVASEGRYTLPEGVVIP